MAVTIRSIGTAWTSIPIEPVLPSPIATAASRSASSQSGTWAAAPARAIPTLANITAAKTSGRGLPFAAAAALPATIRAAAT